MKVVFRYSESTSGPIIKAQWPFVFDLVDDPVEEWDLIEKRLDCVWVLAPVVERLGVLQQSAARYPNIKGPGICGVFINTPGESARWRAASAATWQQFRYGAVVGELGREHLEQVRSVTAEIDGPDPRSISNA